MEVTRRTVSAAPAAAAAAAAFPLPQAPFGKVSVSRLLVGGNPISGFSHQSRAMDEEIMGYFSAANVQKLLAQRERAGITFSMACLYNLSRPHEEALDLAGGPVTGEFFYEPDRRRMLARVQQTKKQCIVFMVYGAGRRCGSREDRLAALGEVFAWAKPQDCVVTGMYPKHANQAADNAQLVRETLASAARS